MKGLFTKIANGLANVKAAIAAKNTVFWKCPEESSYPLVDMDTLFDLITSHNFAEAEAAYATIALSGDDAMYSHAHYIIGCAADIGFRTQDTILLDWCYRMDSSIVNFWVDSDPTPLKAYDTGEYPVTVKWLKDHGAIREY